MFKIPVKPRAYVIPLKVRTSNFVNEMLDPFAQLFQHCWSHTCAKIAVGLKFTIKRGCSVRFWRCTHERRLERQRHSRLGGSGSRKCNFLCFSISVNKWQGKCSGYNYCIFPSSIFFPSLVLSVRCSVSASRRLTSKGRDVHPSDRQTLLQHQLLLPIVLVLV